MTVHEEPMDRLTRICEAMTDAFDQDPEWREGDRCMVFLDDGKHGGIVLHGYEDTHEAIVDLFMHLQAMFRARGQDLQFIGVPESPEGIDD